MQQQGGAGTVHGRAWSEGRGRERALSKTGEERGKLTGRSRDGATCSVEVGEVDGDDVRRRGSPAASGTASGDGVGVEAAMAGGRQGRGPDPVGEVEETRKKRSGAGGLGRGGRGGERRWRLRRRGLGRRHWGQFPRSNRGQRRGRWIVVGGVGGVGGSYGLGFGVRGHIGQARGGPVGASWAGQQLGRPG